MDVQEDGIDGFSFQLAERLGPGGRAMDGANPRIPSEEEGKFFHRGQFVIGDEHGLVIDTAPGEGTMITMRVPKSQPDHDA